MEKRLSFQQMVLEQLIAHMPKKKKKKKKKNLDTDLSLSRKLTENRP